MNVLQEIKQNYLFSNNAVRKIITFNVLIFLVLQITDVLSDLMKSGFSSGILTSYLTLPSSFDSFFHRPWSIISYMFLHDGIMHILFNMLWLYWMGNILHEYLGNKRVYQAYFGGGIFGGVLFMLAYNVFPAFEHVRSSAIVLGASAGVLSVAVATATLLPEYEVRLFFWNIRLKWLALIVVVIDLISINKGNPGGHIAHLGGALFGFIFIKQLRNTTILDKIAAAFSRIFKPGKKLRVHYKTTYMKTEDERKPSQQEIDNILDKISRSGYDSLSKKEKEQLFKASKD